MLISVCRKSAPYLIALSSRVCTKPACPRSDPERRPTRPRRIGYRQSRNRHSCGVVSRDRRGETLGVVYWEGVETPDLNLIKQAEQETWERAAFANPVRQFCRPTR